MLKDWILTTDHPASSYGMPVFVFKGTAYGPRDKISAFRIADIVYEWAQDEARTDEDLASAGKFRQWPDGPQLDRVPGVMGRPRRWTKTTRVTVRVPDEYLAKIEGPLSDWINEAIGQRIKRESR